MRSILVLASLLLLGCQAQQAAPGQHSAPGESVASKNQASGDPALGRALFINRDKGHCLLCHQLQSLDEPSQGNLVPDLSNIGSRLSLIELQARIADSRSVNPETIMPPYNSTDNLHNVAHRYRQQPVLSAQEVLDIAAFLSQQRSPTQDSDQYSDQFSEKSD